MIGAPATPEPAPAPPGRRGASRWSAGRIPIRATGWLRSRLPAGRNWANDALLAAVVIAISLGASYASSGWHRAHGTAGLAGGHGATTVAGYLLLAAGGAALVARRQYPVIVLGVTLADDGILPSGDQRRSARGQQQVSGHGGRAVPAGQAGRAMRPVPAAGGVAGTQRDRDHHGGEQRVVRPVPPGR